MLSPPMYVSCQPESRSIAKPKNGNRTHADSRFCSVITLLLKEEVLKKER